MVKSKNKTKNVEKQTDNVISYASKEEEDEFLKFSDDEMNSAASSDNDEQISSNIPRACEVDMLDDESDASLDDDLDENDDDEDIDMGADDNDEGDDDEDSTQPIDRKTAREQAKVYAEKNKRTIFVGNISPKVTKKVLIQLFNSKKAAGEGAVETVRIRGAISPDQTAHARAKRKAVITKSFADNDNQVLCAYVVFKKEEDVDKCMHLNGHVIDGKHIRVDRIKGKKMTYNQHHCIFIGNLPYSTNEEEVRTAFEQCGQIVNVRLIRNKTDGKVIGIGYVEFTESLGVDFALKLSGSVTIGNRSIRVEKWTDEKTQKAKRQKLQKNENQWTKSFKPKVVAPSNIKGAELKEFIMSKTKKMKKKAEKKKKFVDSKRDKTKNK